MSFKVSKIQVQSNNISFKGEETKEVTEPQKEAEQEENFYERNKTAINAIAALGVAAIALATIRHFNSKPIKETEKQVTTNVRNTLDHKLGDLWQQLTKNKNCEEQIEAVLKSEDPAYKLGGIKYIALSDHLTPKNWENIFDNLISIKPSEKVTEADIMSNIRLFISKLKDAKELNPESINKILEKTKDFSLNNKLNILESPYVQSKSSKEQIKDILKFLDTVEQKEYTVLNKYSPKTATLEDLRTDYVWAYFKDSKIDKTYVEEFTKFLKSDKFSDNSKLQYMDKLTLYTLKQEHEQTEAGVQLLKAMMETIQGMNNPTYTPRHLENHNYNTYELAYRILSPIRSYDKFNICSNEEQLKYLKHIKELALKAPNNTGKWYNQMNLATIEIKTDLFYKTIEDRASIEIEDVEKFVDELLEDFKFAKENPGQEFEEWLTEFYKSNLKSQFSHFSFITNAQIMRLKFQYGKTMRDPEKFANINEVSERITKKINTFGKEYFNMKVNNSQGGTIEKAKSQIIEFLSKNKDFEETVEQLKTQELNKKTLKTLKQKIVIVYHPDRIAAKTEEEQKKATADFQKINGYIEILEKIVD